MSHTTPQTELLCDGKDYSTSLLSLTVVHELGRIPYLRAVLAVLAEETPFKVGSKITTKAGYDGKLDVVFEGILDAVTFSMSSGLRQLTLEARDKAHEMTLGLRTALFLDKSDSEICTAIASARGLATDVPSSSPKHAQVQQYQSTDWDFTLSRLWACGMVAHVKAGKLTGFPIATLGSKNPRKIDAETGTVLELEVIAENRAWFAGVTFRSWDDATQKEETKKAPDVQPKLNGDFKGSGKSSQTVLIPYAVEQAAAEKASEGLLWRLRQGAVRGRIRLFGVYKASPGDGLELSGCGTMADGKTVIWGTRLEIAAGICTSDLQFGWDFLDSLRTHYAGEGLAHPLAGNAPITQGLYPAKVMKLSEDPDKGERIKVHIPLLHDDGKGVWARIATVYAGAGHAVVFRPENDDEVLVGFMGANPACPVILGALPSKAAPAPDALKAKDEKNTCKGWVSKSALTLLMNEEEKSITFTTPAGQTLAINDKEASINLKDKNGNTLIMDKGGITLKSGKDISLEATGNITLKATQNFKAEGLACEVKGQKDIKLSGQAMGEISSSGILTVKGTLVKIN